MNKDLKKEKEKIKKLKREAKKDKKGWICKFCGESFPSYQALGGHISGCKESPKNKGGE